MNRFKVIFSVLYFLRYALQKQSFDSHHYTLRCVHFTTKYHTRHNINYAYVHQLLGGIYIVELLQIEGRHFKVY